MTSVAKVSFTADKTQVTNKTEENSRPKNVTYVSKNPDRTVNATGVVAGTSGMIGGAVLGGTVGLVKLPGQLAKTFVGQDYAKIVSDSVNGFKNSIANSPQMLNLVQTLKSTNSAAVSEEILHIASTMSERLHSAFANDPHAAAVIDKIIDPIVKGLSVKKNLRNYGSGLRGKIESPIGQSIMKILGFNKKTSKIVGSVTGNITEGFGKAVENIKNFTPEEREAWGKVAKQMMHEFENNSKIKVSKDMLKAIGGFGKDFSWITEPFRAMQKSILDGIKRLDRGFSNAPIKTIGKWSAAGAAVCGTISTLGWFGLKKMLMKKETEKLNSANA